MTSDKNKNTGPVFIVGSPRSGTTLLQYMLRSHPRISLPTGESHFIIPLQRRAETFGDLSKLENVRSVLESMYRQNPNFLDTDLHGIKFNIDTLAPQLQQEGCNSIATIISGLLRKNAAGEGKERWGDKTPYYVLHMKALLSMYPDAQFIHLIRDGRDCALSLINRKHDFDVYNIYFAAKYWQQYVDVGQSIGKTLAPETYLEVRYEDMLLDQAGEVRKICDFLGEEFDESVINFKTAGEAGKTPLLQKPVQSSNAEKWRKSMTNWQIRVFESAAGETLARCGYVIDTNTRRLPLPVRAMYRGHNSLMQYLARKSTRFGQ